MNCHYGMDYSQEVEQSTNDLSLLHDLHSSCTQNSWTGTSAKNIVEGNNVIYSEQEFKQDSCFHMKYFCILSGCFPDIPSVYIGKIYDHDTIELWVLRHHENDAHRNKKLFRNPLNGDLAMYPGPKPLCTEEVKTYESKLCMFVSRTKNRDKWLQNNKQYKMPQRIYAYDL